MLFQKGGFYENKMSVKSDQKCGSRWCLSSKTMNPGKSLIVNGFRMQLDFRYNCATPIVIYVAICKHCDDPQTLNFGQTINSTMNRCNGHRDCFKFNNVDCRKILKILSQYPITCGRWQGRPLAFRVTADDSQFSFFDISFVFFWVKDWIKP